MGKKLRTLIPHSQQWIDSPESQYGNSRFDQTIDQMGRTDQMKHSVQQQQSKYARNIF